MATITEELQRLAGLLDRGLITRVEFDQHKQQLMSGSTTGAPGRPSSMGSYRVLGDIGQGGMGRVYRGRHRIDRFAERQGGDVAIKVLHAQYAERADILERFEREAELGIRLEHPGIVRVFELISDGGRVALVMELVEGRPLSEMIGSETGPIPWPRAEALVHQMLSAVEYAHAQGVIHRDLKPENVMISPKGHLKVLDFGIAKDVSTGRTQTGTGMGTVDYMAPEQYIDAKTVDARADIYALGMTFYEMLAGRLPWSGDLSEFILLEAKRDGKIVPPTQFYPDIPAGIVSAVMQCLRPHKAERPSDIAALKALLDPNREPGEWPGSPGAAVPPTTVSRTSMEKMAYGLGKATGAVIGTKSGAPVPTGTDPSVEAEVEVERILVEGAGTIQINATWAGYLQLSTHRLVYTPSTMSKMFGVQQRIIEIRNVLRVYAQGYERRLVVVEDNGHKTRFGGQTGPRIYNYLLQYGEQLRIVQVDPPPSRVPYVVGILLIVGLFYMFFHAVKG
jgi:serine/threonine protein kinase